MNPKKSGRLPRRLTSAPRPRELSVGEMTDVRAGVAARWVQAFDPRGKKGGLMGEDRGGRH